MPDQAATCPGWKIAWARFAKSAAYRALRSFVGTYVVTIIAAWQGAGPWTASSLLHTIENQSDTAIGLGIGAAIVSLGLRAADALPFPTLKDAPIPVEVDRSQPVPQPPPGRPAGDDKPLGPGGV